MTALTSCNFLSQMKNNMSNKETNNKQTKNKQPKQNKTKQNRTQDNTLFSLNLINTNVPLLDIYPPCKLSAWELMKIWTTCTVLYLVIAGNEDLNGHSYSHELLKTPFQPAVYEDILSIHFD